MARSREFDDDWDDRPRPRRKRKRRQSTGLLIALGAGIGVLILMLAGGVGLIVHASSRGSFSLGGVLPHPALAKPVTEATFHQIETREALSSVERKLGPGCPLTPAETAATTVQQPDFQLADNVRITLDEFGRRHPGNAPITQWYQWGSGTNRLYIGFGVEAGGSEPVLLAKCYQYEAGTTYYGLSQHASQTITFGPPEGWPPRK